VYGTIQGEIRHGVFDEPIAGASVYAVGEITKRVVAGAFSGTSRVSFNPVDGTLNLVSPEFNIVDGKYTIPVPLGLYAVGVEAVDGLPVGAGSISLNAQIGAIFGQQNFNEEFYNRKREAAVETRPGADFPVLALPGTKRTGISIVTTDSFNLNPFGSTDFVGFTGSAPGSYYAVAIPAAAISSFAPGEAIAAHSALFHTFAWNKSTVPRFADAILTTGTIAGTTATIDLANPLDRVTALVGQDDDLTPMFVKNPRAIGQKIRDGIAGGTIQNVFLVLRVPTQTPFPGVNGFPPLIGLDGGVATNDVPIFGLSFTSPDGVTFTRSANFNFRFGLVLSRLP
jgi:hypothetical protein